MLKEVGTGGSCSSPRAEDSAAGRRRPGTGAAKAARDGLDLWARASAPSLRGCRTLAHCELGRCLLCPPPVLPKDPLPEK